MKSTLKRWMALALALMLLLPALAEDTEMLLLPDSAVGTEEPGITKVDVLKDGDLDLELELELDGDLEIPVDALDANPLENSALGDLVEAAGEASPEANLLADNAAETVEICYMDAKGKTQD